MNIYAPPADHTAQEIGLDPALQRVLDRVRLRARRRAAWLRKLWAEESEPDGAGTITHAEIETRRGGCLARRGQAGGGMEPGAGPG